MEELVGPWGNSCSEHSYHFLVGQDSPMKVLKSANEDRGIEKSHECRH